MSPLVVVAIFGAGIASFLSPCVIPLVPAYMAMTLGTAAEKSPGAQARGTAGFVLGFAAVFAALGAVAGLVGSVAGEAQDWTRRVGGVLLVVFGVLLLGVFRGRLAGQWHLVQRLPAVGGVGRAMALGVAFAAAWTPCVGPLLGAALVLAAGTGTALQGALLLGAYALGVTVPFVVASLLVTLAGDAWRSGRAFLGRTSLYLQRVSGALLVVMGVLLVADRYSWIGDVATRIVASSSFG